MFMALPPAFGFADPAFASDRPFSDLFSGSLNDPYMAGADDTDPFVLVTSGYNQFLNYGAYYGSAVFRTIDFETQPDGTDWPVGSDIEFTASFNYTNLGVTFSAPIGNPFLTHSSFGFDLSVFQSNHSNRTWIIADLVPPSKAVGIWFPGGTTFSAYDPAGHVLVSAPFNASGGPYFLGIVSEVPISRAIFDDGDNSETINGLIFNVPVPEPATALFLLAIPITLRRRPAR